MGGDNSITQQDYFLEIAMTKHPGSTSDQEIKPLEIPKKYFRPGDISAESRIQQPEIEPEIELDTEPDIDLMGKRFVQDLQKLKERYLPFMDNFAAVRPSHVKYKNLKTFRFRYLDPEECFTERHREGKIWETVTVPDYRGPAHENGKWSAYYICSFSDQEQWRKEAGKRVVLQFQCIDYVAKIFLNGNFIGMHEGFFAPFSFDVTKYMHEENELVILCENDIPILGEGPYLDGDKIYGATGPGWDDPVEGWHHCPAGAGVFGKVTVECRPQVYVEDVFVRTDSDTGTAEVRIGVHNYTNEVKMHHKLSLLMEPRNFSGKALAAVSREVLCIGPGKNEYRYLVPISDYRLWEHEKPWLYEITVSLQKEADEISCLQRFFGIKEFISDESSVPKGKFYLNRKPIVLRGVNEMGHLQQCVMNEDFEQLVEDILIAKLCNVNYYRVTQRPVQEEIYDYFDMLGMMHQCDFPLFSYLRRPQFAEAVRQVVEMEHLVRSHVSTVMVTFINEPVCLRKTEDKDDKFSRRYETKGHRHLLRDELEAFFAAARKAVYTENPDRVIKNVEGDYDGPTMEGMPDFHCYTMWYTSHGQPIGKLMRGYLPPVKSGWMTGCGEYGAEGLDNLDIMKERYPKAWLEGYAGNEDIWFPDKIVRAQTHSVHGDWYCEQHSMEDWVTESQKHQALATKLMTDAFRRRGDLINQTAIHLLIDAWPSGWMKALVGCDRMPKPAYFAYQEALKPLKLSLYTGRKQLYEDETVMVEGWVCNDTHLNRILRMEARICEDRGEAIHEGEAFYEGETLYKGVVSVFNSEGEIPAASAECFGLIPVTPQKTGRKGMVNVTAFLLDEEDHIIHTETVKLKVFPRPGQPVTIRTFGSLAENCLIQYDYTQNYNCTWISGITDKEHLDTLCKHVEQGNKGILLLEAFEGRLWLGQQFIQVRSCGDRFFVDAVPDYKQYDLAMLYNSDLGYIDATADRIIETQIPGEELFFTYEKQGFISNYGPKKHLAVAFACKIGKGTLILTTLKTKGHMGCNCDLDQVFVSFCSSDLPAEQEEF